MSEKLDFVRDGARHFPGAAGALLDGLRGFARSVPDVKGGARLHGDAGLRGFLSVSGAITRIASGLLGEPARPVRAILFDKTPDANWSLAWHQDRTICVRERVEVPGFGPWTVKQGFHHVGPPMAILERMVTLRVHLDDVPQRNAPLLVALGTHRLGRIAESEVDAAVEEHTVHMCLAEAGDVWAYSTPILHASDAAGSDGHRRVLQVDYSADELPGGLEWLGV